MTLRKQICDLFAAGMNVEAYRMLKPLLAAGGSMGYYLKGKFQSRIVMAQVQLHEWENIQNLLADRRTVLDTFFAIQKLDEQSILEVRENLNSDTNLLAMFLFDSKNTDLDDWTDDIIQNWIDQTDRWKELIINDVNIDDRIEFVKTVMSYVHGALKSLPTKPMFSDMVQIEYEDCTPPSQQLVNFRGTMEDFDMMVKERMRDEYRDQLQKEPPRSSIQMIREFLQEIGGFSFSREDEVVFAQYPLLYLKYHGVITFVDRPITDFDSIIDLIDNPDVFNTYIEHLVISSKRESKESLKDAIFEEFGVVI